ncbi:MAG TPA: radical SAM protein [Methanobacteriaceae archaeon]|nr:radical SAM protein [Methanobacteriaceae archaeon]
MMVDSLKTYYEVSLNKRESKCKIASQTSATNSETLKSLWNEHQKVLKRMKNGNSSPEACLDFSFMDLKIKIARILFTECVFCPWKCRVDRRFEVGVCGVTKSGVASEFLHLGEEAPLIPSHTIFFAGCNLNCVYCQNWDISQNPQLGMYIRPSNLARRIDQRRRDGSRNVNFVGGDPTPNLHYVLKTMHLTTMNVPVVWNSNMYLSWESMQLLEGFVDLYLTDFKYGNDECARKLSGISNYMKVVGTNHKWANKAGDMIIRHLVLPDHGVCCSLPLMHWIYENLGEEVVINIMGQYQPQYHAFRYNDISRPTSSLEVEKVVDYAKDLGFINIIR